jgi:hypothetical protein
VPSVMAMVGAESVTAGVPVLPLSCGAVLVSPPLGGLVGFMPIWHETGRQTKVTKLNLADCLGHAFHVSACFAEQLHRSRMEKNREHLAQSLHS